MNKQKEFYIFSISLLIAFIFWRLWIRLIYNENTFSFLRQSTGLNIHHYHYGIILLLIATLFFIFYKLNNLSIVLAGLGFGTYFDGFLSRLFNPSIRPPEIINYNQKFIPSIFLFIILIIIVFIFYKTSKK